jgi:ribosomal protein L35
LLAGKSPKRRRSLGKSVVVDKTDMWRIIGSLPFSH